MQDESDKLVQDLVTLAVARSAELHRTRVREQLARATAQAWNRCMHRLDEHRLMPLVHWGLERANCVDLVPTIEARQLASQFEYSRAMNLLRWMSLQGLATRMQAVGVVPIACKGIVLAQCYYPHPATRFMNDIDLWIDSSGVEQTQLVLSRLGYTSLPEKTRPDGDCYQNPMGMVVDLHHRMRIFEDLGDMKPGLTEEFVPHAFRVHEPHALIAHLAAHLEGHRRETGPMLCWLFDLGFVVGNPHQRLDPSRLQQLVSHVANWNDFLAALRLLKDVFDMTIPADLLQLAQSVEPLRLSTVLSRRRLALWGLPRPRGWARLLLRSLRRTKAGDRPWPRAHDLFAWPFDQLRDRRHKRS